MPVTPEQARAELARRRAARRQPQSRGDYIGTRVQDRDRYRLGPVDVAPFVDPWATEENRQDSARGLQRGLRGARNWINDEALESTDPRLRAHSGPRQGAAPMSDEDFSRFAGQSIADEIVIAPSREDREQRNRAYRAERRANTVRGIREGAGAVSDWAQQQSLERPWLSPQQAMLAEAGEVTFDLLREPWRAYERGAVARDEARFEGREDDAADQALANIGQSSLAALTVSPGSLPLRAGLRAGLRAIPGAVRSHATPLPRTRTPLYRGVVPDESRRSALGDRWWTSSPEVASSYAPGAAQGAHVLMGSVDEGALRLLHVDAPPGTMFRSIPIESLPSELRRSFPRSTQTVSTNEIAAAAESLGYQGVTFRGIRDTGYGGASDVYRGFGSGDPGRVFALFDDEIVERGVAGRAAIAAPGAVGYMDDGARAVDLALPQPRNVTPRPPPPPATPRPGDNGGAGGRAGRTALAVAPWIIAGEIASSNDARAQEVSLESNLRREQASLDEITEQRRRWNEMSLEQRQDFLRGQGVNTGGRGAGPMTDRAFSAYLDQLDQQEEQARGRISEAQREMAQEAGQVDPTFDLGVKIANAAALFGGMHFGMRGRSRDAARANTAINARNAAVNESIPTGSVSMGTSSAAAADRLDRAGAFNQMFVNAGRGHQAPFNTAANQATGYSASPGAGRVADLYRPGILSNRFLRGEDVKALGYGGAESYAFHTLAEQERNRLEELEAQRAREPENRAVAREIANTRLRIEGYDAASRAGLGYAGGRAFGMFSTPYSVARPSRLGDAEGQIAQLNRYLTIPPPAPRAPAPRQPRQPHTQSPVGVGSTITLESMTPANARRTLEAVEQSMATGQHNSYLVQGLSPSRRRLLAAMAGRQGYRLRDTPDGVELVRIER